MHRRYDPVADAVHEDMDGPGMVLVGVDILPSEFPREASTHFGEALLPFIRGLAWSPTPDGTPLGPRNAPGCGGEVPCAS